MRQDIRAARTASDSSSNISTVISETIGYVEIVAGYWADIGVDVTLSIHRVARLSLLIMTERNYESIYGGMASREPRTGPWDYYNSDLGSAKHISWAESRTLCWPPPKLPISAPLVIDEQMQAASEHGMEVIRHHYMIWGPMAPGYQASQPWVKGFNGETLNTVFSMSKTSLSASGSTRI